MAEEVADSARVVALSLLDEADADEALESAEEGALVMRALVLLVSSLLVAELVALAVSVMLTVVPLRKTVSRSAVDCESISSLFTCHSTASAEHPRIERKEGPSKNTRAVRRSSERTRAGGTDSLNVWSKSLSSWRLSISWPKPLALFWLLPASPSLSLAKGEPGESRCCCGALDSVEGAVANAG